MTSGDSLGAMREQVTLQAEERISGAGGRATNAYPLIATCWAHAQEQRQKAQSSGGTRTDHTVVFRLRFDPDFLACRHISWRGKRYAVTRLKPIGIPETWLEITAHRNG